MQVDGFDSHRADWSQSDGRRPPIMGERQTFTSYMRGCERWFCCIDLEPRKAGAMVLTRGLHRNVRTQEIARRCDIGQLSGDTGLKYLLLFTAKELGTSEAPA